MNNSWKEALHFSQRERRGIFIFTALIGTFLYLPTLFEKHFQSPAADFSTFKLAIEKYDADQLVPSSITNSDKPIPSLFNPNSASLEELLNVGLSEPIAQRIINYRNAGGFFYRKADLKKIYGLKESRYERIQQYIDIPSNKRATNKKKAKKSYTKKIASQQNRPISPFRFDPNEVSLQELSAMGLPATVANQIINYRKKGGTFREKEDLKKIYALSAPLYQQLVPFIILRKPTSTGTLPTSHTTSTKIVAEEIKIDINLATIGEWQKLKGIGPYYAKKIVSFREKLGGFASTDQVATTYGLPDSVFQKISSQLIPSPITSTMSVNTMTIEELKAHPYIKKHQAVAIVNYRKNHGVFDSIEKIKKVQVLSGEDLKRIAPYLSFEK